MNEFEKIIEDIRAAMISEADPSEAALSSLDERYRTAVAEANARLRRCDELLNSGHRAEAIQESEVVPNLLELIGVLDFPEHSNWSEYLKSYGFDEAPALDLMVAESLNTAYNEESSDEQLMRLHRLHALRRSPLRTRLAIVRQLAERQSGNPIWQEDIPAYEEARHREISQAAKEIESELSTVEKASREAQGAWEKAIEQSHSAPDAEDQQKTIAAAAKSAQARKSAAMRTIRDSVDQLALLEQEVRSEAWRKPVPEEAAKRVIDLHTQARSSMAKFAMEQIGEDLARAHNEWDAEEARQLRERWKVQAKIAQLSPGHPVWKQAEPALQWLEQQDASDQAETDYQEAISELEYALDHGLSRAELEKRQYRLDNMDRDVPRALEIRVSEQLRALDVAAIRRSRLIFASTALGIILIGAAIGFFIYQRGRNNTKNRYVAALSGYVEMDEFAKASNLLTDLETNDPAIRESIEIQDLVQEMNNKIASEKQRAENFQNLVREAKQEGQDWKMHGNALAKLNRAEQVAGNAEETNLLRNVREEVNAIHTREVKKNESQRRTEFEALFAEFEVLEDHSRKDLDSISKLATRFKVFQGQTFVPEDVRRNVDSVLARLSAIRSAELTEKSHSESLERLWTSSSRRESFEAEVEEYATAYENKRPLAAALKRMLADESSIWDGLEQRNGFVRQWSGRNYRDMRPSQVQRYVLEGNAIFSKYGDLPGMAIAKGWVETLVPIANRVESDGKAKYEILRDLSAENSSLNVAIVREEGLVYRYYFDGEESPKPSIDGQRVKIYRYIDDQFRDTEQVLFRQDSLVSTDSSRVGYQSPMSRFVRKLEANLNQEMPWEQRFYLLVFHLENEIDMEPIRKVRLLAEILDIGCKGSQPFSSVFAKDLQMIRDSRLNYRTSQWVDSTDKDIRAERRIAVSLLRNLGYRTLEGALAKTAPVESKTPAKKLEALRAELAKLGPLSLGSRYEWCSCLKQDEQAGWSLTSPVSRDMKNAKLVTFFRANGGISHFEVGQVVGGKVQIDQQAGTALKVGRPVFAQLAVK